MTTKVYNPAKKNFDVEYGFNIYRLNNKEASKVAQIMINDLSKNIGSKYKQRERELKIEQAEKKRLEEIASS